MELDGRAAIGRDRGTLKRTIALLFALAGLADRASHAPWPVRVVVLAILRHGETVARLLLVETSHHGAPPNVAVGPAGSSPADAVALALSLRLVALALAALITRSCDPHPISATTNRLAAKAPAPADRLPQSTRRASSAIRGPPQGVCGPFPKGVFLESDRRAGSRAVLACPALTAPRNNPRCAPPLPAAPAGSRVSSRRACGAPTASTR